MIRPLPRKGDHVRRAALLFAGGPAPSANAVISAAAISFLEDGRQVVGFFHGYSNLQDYHPVSRRLLPDEHYRVFAERDLRGLRNSRGVIIGTARSNPGKDIRSPADLDDPKKTALLRNVYNALVDLEIDALISIGGDDTLKTANLLYEFQNRLSPDARRVQVIHLPKTIDNDYRGIDFTFGFFTAVDFMAKEVENLRADAIATSSYFIIETMGRKAGWLSYGVAIAGEANLVVAPEDVRDDLCVDEKAVDPANGVERVDKRLSLEALADRIVDLILTRERRGKHYGTVVLAEGLAELLPASTLENLPRDEHGHVSLGRIDLGKLMAKVVAERYEKRTGRKKKLAGVQLGYESRCSPPHAFDVMLGSQHHGA
ncbi:MAG TPA: 6-phosphofructokinase, partial [Candidatus Acidoferrum sp.]|nr:6-phosphofructokinase [Candidatus Acidoferrum sp.]